MGNVNPAGADTTLPHFDSPRACPLESFPSRQHQVSIKGHKLSQAEPSLGHFTLLEIRIGLMRWSLGKSIQAIAKEEKKRRLVLLSWALAYQGAFAAEANILGDPDAADFVFGQTERIRCVGLDVTLTCQLPNERLETLKGSSGKFGPFLHQIIQFYLQYHR